MPSTPLPRTPGVARPTATPEQLVERRVRRTAAAHASSSSGASSAPSSAPSSAAPPERAEALYRCFCERLGELGLETAEGVFGAMMEIELVNDGPVTIWLDTEA